MLRLVLAAVVGLALLGTAGVAAAEEPPSSVSSTPTEQADPPAEDADPGEVEQPRPLIAAAASCHSETADVTVYVYEDRDEPFTVRLTKTTGSFHADKTTTLDEEHLVHTAMFESVGVGEYIVRIVGAEGPADDVRVIVKDCDDVDPGDGALAVDIECKAGWGIVTFQVTNPATGEVISYTLSVNGIPAFEIELSPGLFLRITENGYEDGKYTAKLTGDGVNVTKEFTVKCEKGNAPRLRVFAACDGKDELTAPAPVLVNVHNPNRVGIDYTVVLDVLGSKQTKSVSVGGGRDGEVTFPAIPAGDHPITVTGSDTEAKSIAQVDFCGDVKIDPDGLQVSSRCTDKTSVVTFRFFLKPPFPATAKFSVDGTDSFNQTVTHAGEGPYEWVRHVGKFTDGTYTARLTGATSTTEQFVVDCDGVPNPTPTSSTPPPSTTPAPQARNLASTGAAVGGMAMLGLLGLGLGGGLLLISRRRRAGQD